PVPEEKIAIEHRDFPSHWPRIGGQDFGYGHPFAAVEVVWDRDTDTAYVARCYRLKEATPIEHAAALRPWGRELRWSWPRDGQRETLEGAGIALAEQYRARLIACMLTRRRRRTAGPVNNFDGPIRYPTLKY